MSDSAVSVSAVRASAASAPARKPAGIILAAGTSSRMGRDKALLPFRGSTFLNHLIALLSSKTDPLIVVLGHNAGTIRKTLPAGTRIVVNQCYELGMLSSLQTGLRALPVEANSALFTPVDHPAVRGETIDSLIAAFHRSGQPLVIPRYEGRRGHPAILSREILDAILDLSPGASAKDVIRSHRHHTFFLDTADPGILSDIDLPADYQALIARDEPAL